MRGIIAMLWQYFLSSVHNTQPNAENFLFSNFVHPFVLTNSTSRYNSHLFLTKLWVAPTVKVPTNETTARLKIVTRLSLSMRYMFTVMLGLQILLMRYQCIKIVFLLPYLMLRKPLVQDNNNGCVMCACKILHSGATWQLQVLYLLCCWPLSAVLLTSACCASDLCLLYSCRCAVVQHFFH